MQNIYSNLYRFENKRERKMESHLTDVNFLYLIISVIILIFVYGMLIRTQRHIRDKKILIEADENAYLVNYDICEAHLNNIKKNIMLLYKTTDISNCKKLREYIQQTHKDLSKFVEYSQDPTDADLIRYELINKLELLKYDSDDLKLKRLFAGVILDIEAIVYSLRNSTCSNNRLVLKSLHKLLNELYKNQCSEISSYEEMFTDVGRETFVEGFEDMAVIHSTKTANNKAPGQPKTVQSQNVTYDMNGEEYANQTETKVYKCDVLEKNTILKKDLVSQDFDCSSDYILTYKGTQPYVPFCDIDKLRSERVKLHALTLDQSCVRSLRNDYDYLDA